MLKSAIDLLYLAKQNGIEIGIQEDRLQLKLPKDSVRDKSLLHEIKENKQLLIDFLRKNKKSNQSQQNKITRVNRDEVDKMPLSFSQERLWFIDRLRGSTHYHMPVILRLKGNLNKKALVNALESILERHEVLRTVFLEEEDGAASQFIKDKCDWVLSEIDGCEYNENPAALKQYIESLIKQPFDLSKDYMLRCSLIKIEEDHYILAVTIHHIASDGWSLSILVKEVVELYSSLDEDRPTQLQPLEIQYADFALWQRQFLSESVLEKKIAYWKKKLGGVEALQLPTDYPRQAVQSIKGASFKFSIDQDILVKLEEISRQQGTTLFMTLVAAFNILLFRYSGQTDICVGTPIAGRQQKEVEELIGFFVNTLALRSEVNDQSSFIELLQQIKTTVLDAFDHQDIPFEKVVEAVVKERDINTNPIFQVLFTMQNTPPAPELRLGNVHLSREVFEDNTSPLDLIFNLTKSDNGLTGSVMYCTELFSAETTLEMVEHYRELLRSITESPDKRIAELKMITNDQEEQLLHEFNHTPVKLHSQLNIIDLFESQVSKNADELAILFKEEQLTFTQLNAKSNQLASLLKLKGVKDEVFVPVCIEQSADMVVAILAILKAGGAYIPIDPELSEDRVNFILKDAQANIVITNRLNKSKLLNTIAQEIIYIDSDWPNIALHEPENVKTAIKDSHAAYIIYTSGSTGQPKGVVVEHRNLVSYLQNKKTSYINQRGKNPGSFIHLSYTFDASVTAIFMPLIFGKSIVIGSKQSVEVFDDINFHKYAPYDFLKITPSHLELLQSRIRTKEGIPVTGKLVIGGEALLFNQLNYMIEEDLDIEIINEYGPTEATVGCSTYCFTTSRNEIIQNNIPIGKPIDNVQLYILNEVNQLQPVGIPGEICIGGAGISRGYLNRPELNNQAFIINPFDKDSRTRLYKTGDIGKWLKNGNVDYLGRKDDQVKIRGHRVELGEIEAYLSSFPGILNARVITAENQAMNDKKLNAYVQIDKETLPLLNRYQHLLLKKQIKNSDLNILPNGLPILNSNLNEVRFLYQEIFTDHCYLKHGITLKQDSCVIDIGANAGFFNVFLNILSKNITVYAFEPIPEVYHYLVANRELYNIKGKAFQLAILDKETEIDFNYFPDVTIVSGISDDRIKVKDVVRSYIQNSQEEELLPEEMESLLEAKLESKRIRCKTKTISQIIEEENIEKIDLLKIDVENSEHLVIGGLLDEDWDKVQSVIIEVHDLEGRLNSIKTLLEEKGFHTYVEKEEMLSKDDILYNLFALRVKSEKGLSAMGDSEKLRLVEWMHPAELHDKMRISLEKDLPSYMVPSNIILLDQFPLTSNGKIDKKSLPDPEGNELLTNQYEAPVREIEKGLVGIWQDLLELDQVGIHDDFFGIGGHSLLAVRLISAIRKQLGVEIRINDVFDYPTIALLSRQIESQNESQNESPVLSSIEVFSRPDHIPLSFSQERLWFIDQLEGTLPYHIPAMLRLKGALNIAALEYAVKIFIERHEVLRTVIYEKEGNGYQRIQPPGDWHLPVIDGSEYKEDTEGLDRFINDLVRAPFNLSKDLMLRTHLLKVNENEYLLVATMHHIASDGWSISILVKELTELYKSYETGVKPVLEPLAIQYADYAIWQRKYLQEKVLSEKLAYWKTKLHDVVPLQLPLDFSRPPVQSFSGASLRFSIDKELGEKLNALSNKQGVTLFMTLLSAFKVLISRYTGQYDICIGTPTAGRQQSEVEPLIGFFINTLALRSDLSGDLSFADLLQQVKETTLEAYTHQELPFEKIVDAVVKERVLDRTPLFQVMFILQNTPEVPILQLGNTHVSVESTSLRTSKFDLTLSLNETLEGLTGWITYSSDLFTETTINRLAGNFKELLKSVVNAPQTNIRTLSILSPAEERTLLMEINSSEVEYPSEKSMVDLFEEQSAKTPDAVAIVFEGKSMSYLELNNSANQLAHYLRAKGITAEAFVPVCVERSLEMIIAILGILKAGAAYVPIDTNYPIGRIKYILEDTGAKIAIAGKYFMSRITAAEDVDVLVIDRDWGSIGLQKKTNLNNTILPNHLAYVIYTSGSTGRPKGVMIEHKALLDHCFGVIKSAGLTLCRSFALFSPLVFDAGHSIIHSALILGATLHVLSDELLSNGSNLNSYINNNEIDCIKIVPSLWLNYADANNLILSKKVMIFGGEGFSLNILNRLIPENYCGVVYNHYGPTETAIGKTIHKIDFKRKYLKVPIGKPFSNTKIYILDVYGQLVPIGAAGELHIVGDGLARGYLNQPELTAAKFIKDPFCKNPTCKMYKTGDLVRWLDDGNIEYLGRIDNQVKIRGYRIELDEIENVLSQHEFIQDAIVLAKTNHDGDKHLVAYLVCASEVSFEKEVLSSYLKDKLPAYMIPSFWVQLAEMPLTSNGKIDRNHLPEPGAVSIGLKEYVGPRNEIEDRLSEIWKNLLRLERISMNDNFFELGGHSLLTMRMRSAIEKILLVSIPIQALFQFATINDLSRYIELQLDKETNKQSETVFKMIDI